MENICRINISYSSSVCTESHLIKVAEQVGHGGEFPQAAAGQAKILSLRVAVAQDVEERVTLPHEGGSAGTRRGLGGIIQCFI